MYTVRNSRCLVCDNLLTIEHDHSACFETPCGICECLNGAHWITNEGTYAGCADCSDCEGYATPSEVN